MLLQKKATTVANDGIYWEDQAIGQKEIEPQQVKQALAECGAVGTFRLIYAKACDLLVQEFTIERQDTYALTEKPARVVRAGSQTTVADAGRTKIVDKSRGDQHDAPESASGD